MENGRCKFWLPKKNRFCANSPLNNSSLFCGNHTTRSDARWIPCPVDPSHSVLEENIELHLKKRCPLLKHVQALSLLPFYQKGINGGDRDDQEQPPQPQTLSPKHHVLPSPNNFNITSETKRNAVYSMTAPQISKLISKIHSVHASISIDIRDSYKIPEACHIWIHRQVDRKLPFQEKHVLQQASILGNLEEFGVLKTSGGDVVRDQIDCHVPSGNYANVPAVVEFGAGRGYLTQMLVDCYGINKVILVERKSYKLKLKI